MTAVEVLGSVDELADGTAGSVDAATGAAIGPYRKSRLKHKMWGVVSPSGAHAYLCEIRDGSRLHEGRMAIIKAVKDGEQRI